MKHASAFEMKKQQRLDDERARLFKEKEDAANLKREAKNARRRAQDAASKKQKAAAAKAAAEKAAEKAAAEKASAEKAAAEKAAAEKAAKEALALKSAKTANAKTAAVAAFSEARCKQLEKDVAVAKRKLVEEIALRTQIEKEKDGYRSQLTIAAQAANVTVTETRAGSFKVAAVVPSPGKANSRLVRQQGKRVQILMMLFIIIIHKCKKQSSVRRSDI
jgi:colicin import membrane protein